MAKSEDSMRRQCIIAAAYSVLMEKGYTGASTLEIARKARVSKRELYAEFGSKAGILEALIASTSAKMQVPLATPKTIDQSTFTATLTAYGTTALTELTSPHVVAVHRLAIAAANHSSELGKILDQRGRESNRRALIALMTKARRAGVLKTGDPDLIAAEFFVLLSGDLMLRLMLGVAERPTEREIKRRADRATNAILRLYARSDPSAPSV